MSGPNRSGGGGLDDLFDAAGERSGEHRALIMLGVIGLALALVLGAFFVGRGLAAGDDTSASPAEEQSQAEPDNLLEAALGRGDQGGGGAAASSKQTKQKGKKPSSGASKAPNGKLQGKAYRGRVRPAAVRAASATCRAPSGVDSGGNRVGYPANHMLDSDPSTAWRCNGNGRGVMLRFNLKGKQRVAAVGLVPGYAKTDPFSGADRYAQNRRIASVRWTFDDGSWVEQSFDTGRKNRSLQTMRIPPVRTGSIRLTIEDTVDASRNTVAVSTVRLARARG